MENSNNHQGSVLAHILEITEELNKLQDIDTILDRILYESRKITNAEAGSIFLKENDKLHFRYVHNDVLYQAHSNNKHIYSNMAVPLDKSSIVGYCAITGKTLRIDDAYALDSTLPYHFNSSFDEKTGFRTRSIMTIPLAASRGEIVGVIQIINSRTEEGEVAPFTDNMETYVSFFARHACFAIERGKMTRELILRMMKMAELRDPKETGAHVQRVGAYSAEIYHRWALNKGLDIKEIKRNKDLIRLAAMLHDVGKVGISDTILKKPARLTEEEFTIMKYHTVFGERLFVNSTSELDAMSLRIAIGHHEKWNGKGYPGSISGTEDEETLPTLGTGYLGDQIPIEARICALADVFDALGSVRSYKERWPDSKVLELIRKERGEHFDPEVVDAFFEILDVIKAIRDRYS